MSRSKQLTCLLLLLLTTPSAWAIYGAGSSTNPYQIYSAADLHKFRDIVNGTNGETQNAGAWAKLYKDIDNLGAWTPIGTSTTPYTGTFEGNNHKINGMSILNYTTSFQGLFGCIEDATVSNLSLSGSMTSAQMLSNNSDNTNGSATVVGSALGQSLVKNISSSVDWTITNTTQTHLGGIVGCLSGTTSVRDCTYSGTMNAGQSKDCLGGIVGYAKPSCVTSIINCFFCGKISTSPATDVAPPVLGGILGYISDGSGVFGGVKGCYSCGTLSAGDGKTTYVSAIIGFAKSKSIYGNNVRDNYYLSGTALRAIVAESTSPFDATTNKAITISVKANDESYGSVSHRYVNPTSTSATKLEVSATPSGRGVFGSWSDGGSQTHQVALNADIDITATFRKIEAKAVLSGNTLTFYCDDITHEGTTYSLPAANSTKVTDWYEKRSDITTVVFDESFRDYRPVNCNFWFIGSSYLTSIKGMENFNTSEVTQMKYLFCKCIKLSSLTIYNFDMSKVTDATSMFYDCHNLNTLTLKSIPYLKDGTFNSWFEGKTVNCELDANSTIYEGTNYLPTITNCNHYINYDIGDSRAPTCTESGGTMKHCQVCDTDYNTGDVPALGHEYKAEWSWADDVSNATLTLTCSHDANHQVVLDKNSDPKVIITHEVTTPATCIAMGKTTYNASVTYNEQQYTAKPKQIDIAIDPNAHDYDCQNPEWSWADDASNATLTFTCSHDASHHLVLDKDSDPKVIITSEVTTPATCTAMGKKTYNASVTYNEQQYTAKPKQIDIAIDPNAHNTRDDDGYCTGCHQPLPPSQASDGYYQINKHGELLWYLNKVNASNEITINGRLMKDIVINDGTFDAQGNYTAGTSGKPLVDGFMTGHTLKNATFDGNNHAIVGLYGVSTGNCGLFAQILISTVQDLTLRNCYLKSTGDKVGTIGGYTNISNITNCHATDCYIEGNSNVGGIVGSFDGEGYTLTHCGSNSTVSGSDWFVGGVCGDAGNGVTISYCYATGKVSGSDYVGGVCGSTDIGVTISYCYATGTVSGNNNVGGVCGGLSWSSDSPDILCHLTSCYFTGQVSEGGKGICNPANDNQVTLCYTTVKNAGADDQDRCVVGNVSLDRFKSGEIAWLLNGTIENGKWKAGPTNGTQPWRQDLPSATSGQTADTTPVLDTTHATVYASMPCQISYSNSPDVIIDHTLDDDGICTKCHKPDTPVLSSDGYYDIYSANQLLWYLNKLHTNGKIVINGRLMKDIVINDGTFDADGRYTAGTSNRALVDGFMTGHTLKNATFDGNNHAIVGLYGIGTVRCALFAEITEATVKNLTLRNCYLKSTGSDVGAIAGRVDNGEINNCYATDCYLKGYNCVGGIVGAIYGKDNTLTRCGSNSTVSGNLRVGGVCGYAENSTISYCYSTGEVSGGADVDEGEIVSVGGVCGLFKTTSIAEVESTLTSCYFTGQVSKCGNGICGNTFDNDGQVTHCYTTVAEDYGLYSSVYSADRCVEGGVSLDRFKSGEIAWLLNDNDDVWRQAIGTDDSPRLVGPMVYYDDQANKYYNGCDLNCDYKLTVVDVNLLIDAIVKGTTTSDMEIDGKEGIDQGDVEALVKIILGK